MKKIITLLILLSAGSLSHVMAGVEVNEFDNKQDQQQFTTLVNELRCLVCQNQNLADSNAELAQDLRKEVYQMIKKGKSSDDIVSFMVDRYGDFVLYKPPFKPQTYILWLGPFFVLFFAILFLILFIRKNKSSVKTEISNDEKLRAEELIKSISSEKE